MNDLPRALQDRIAGVHSEQAMSTTIERYLQLQFKKGLRHGHVHNAELNPSPTETVRTMLKRDESCIVLVHDKRHDPYGSRTADCFGRMHRE